jgi:cyclophilin family peptidyl-prolyl cis-trans isomerase
MKDEAVVPEVLEGVSTVALEAINRSEIDMQITTAKRYPRSVERFRKQALAMATVDEETAASMFYALPRSGKLLEGPSARLAEIVVVCWGNVRAGARVVEVGDNYVSAQGVFHDLENNVYVSQEVRRRITDSKGRRYNDDMIGVTGNAAASVAYRNVVFRGVPRTYVNAILREAKEVAVGKALSLEQRRAKLAEWFAKVGASEAELVKLAALHAAAPRSGLADLTLDDITMLRGLATALKDGETNMAEVMRPVREAEASAAGPRTLDDLAAAPKAAAATAAPATPRDCAHDGIAVQLGLTAPIDSITCKACGEAVPGRMTSAEADRIAAAQEEREPGADDDDVDDVEAARLAEVKRLAEAAQAQPRAATKGGRRPVEG